MKKLIVVLSVLAGLAAPVRAGMYYSNDTSASSNTLRVGGVVKITDPASPYVPTITLNGVGGVLTVVGTGSFGSSLYRSTFNSTGDLLARGPIVAGGSTAGNTYGNISLLDTSGVEQFFMTAYPGVTTEFKNGGGIAVDSGITASSGTFRNTTEPQIQAVGYSDYGTGAYHGKIKLGSDATYFGALQFDGTGNTRIHLGNSYALGGIDLDVAGVGSVGAPKAALSAVGFAGAEVRVGISTGIPQTTLDVNGNAQFGSGATKSTFTATGDLTVGGKIGAGGVVGGAGFPLRVEGGAQFNEAGDATNFLQLQASGDSTYYDSYGTAANSGGHVFRVNDASKVALTLDATGGAGLYSRTKAQLLTIEAPIGALYYCSDCADATSGKPTVVIATGTSAGNFGTLPVGAFQ